MIHRPCRRASESSAARSSRVAVQPVGLLGDTMNRARVFGLTAPASRSKSSDQPSLPNDIGTSTARAPITPEAAAAFGQVGVGISGRNVTSLAPYQRNTGVVFQNYALLPHMTVLRW